MNYRRFYTLVVVIAALLTCFGAFLLLPQVSERLAWHASEWQARIQYALNPPEDKAFVPDTLLATIVQATLQADPFFTTPVLPLATATKPPPATVYPTAVISATPLPSKVILTGVVYESQQGLWNYCAPSNLAMALSYWGWQGNRLDTGQYLKPFTDDKNVMPYEMENYIKDKTAFSDVLRYGGNTDLLKALIAGGYPVLIEAGVYIRSVISGNIEWTGHYTLLTGYDDATQSFNTQDSYYKPDYPVSYDQLIQEWRSFNYVFLVIYPSEKQQKIDSTLGVYADLETSKRIAAQKAAEEATGLKDIGQFFAWFNRGSSMVQLGEYQSAAAAYDEAFSVYSTLPNKDRPWRMMWYQDGPYSAYYFTGRYQDVINLANQTLNIYQPYLEESYYWRARANIALGNRDSAVDDLRESLKLHAGYKPSLELMQTLGVSN